MATDTDFSALSPNETDDLLFGMDNIDQTSWPLPPDPTPIASKPYSQLSNEAPSNTMHHLALSSQEQTVHADFAAHKPATPAGMALQNPNAASLPPPWPVSVFDTRADTIPPEPDTGYMNRSSPFALDAPADQASFMHWYPPGKATLTYQDDNGTLASLSNINLWIIQERCPLLAAAFEESRSGPRLYLEAVTSSTVLPFLQFLYTEAYLLKSNAGDAFADDVPTSLLTHAKLYRLGSIYELPELKKQAYINILRQCEFGCSSPEKPIDLCSAIRFIYAELRGHDNIIDTVINYCVSCFLDHRLAEDEEFRKLAYELRPFHQDLCKNSFGREFSNETAAAIIQMPFEPYAPETYASREDVVFHFHSSDDFESPRKRKRREQKVSTSSGSTLVLPIRAAAVQKESGVVREEPSEDEGFSIIRKKRASSSVSSDYEVISIPAEASESSNGTCSEGEEATLVKEDTAYQSHDASQPGMASLPIRLHKVAEATAAATHAGSDSESEWTLL